MPRRTFSLRLCSAYLEVFQRCAQVGVVGERKSVEVTMVFFTLPSILTAAGCFAHYRHDWTYQTFQGLQHYPQVVSVGARNTGQMKAWNFIEICPQIFDIEHIG